MTAQLSCGQADEAGQSQLSCGQTDEAGQSQLSCGQADEAGQSLLSCGQADKAGKSAGPQDEKTSADLAQYVVRIMWKRLQGPSPNIYWCYESTYYRRLLLRKSDNASAKRTLLN
jgi:hypothetical protein